MKFDTYTEDGQSVIEATSDDETVFSLRVSESLDPDELATSMMEYAMETFGDGGNIVFESESYSPELLEFTGIGTSTAEKLEAEGVYTSADLRDAFEDDSDVVDVISSRWHDTIRSELGI